MLKSSYMYCPKGSFAVPNAGIWRFTFTAGDVYFPEGSYGYLRLKVDGTIVAKSYTDPNSVGGMVKKTGHRLRESAS